MAISWYALTVKPQHERAVIEQLLGRVLQAYAPFYKSRRHWSDRTKTIDAPLFPRYVFCRFDAEDRLKVLRIPSVTGVVGFGGTPHPISDGEIEVVKRIVCNGLGVAPWPLLRVGSHVRIVGGPLAGIEGILAKQKTIYRVVVNIEMLRRAVAVEVDQELIEASTPAPNSVVESQRSL